MNKIKIALVDDHELFRDGLLELVNSFNVYKVIIEAGNGTDFIKQIELKGLPDIVLLDINMKEMDGFQTAEWLKANHPQVKILVLSMYENENAIIRMIKSGAKGYILKNIRKNELENALSSLVTKGYHYTDLITGKIIHMINSIDETKAGQSFNDLSSMSAKEIEFLKLACSELTYKEIAEKMYLSPHTIDGYRDSSLETLSAQALGEFSAVVFL